MNETNDTPAPTLADAFRRWERATAAYAAAVATANRAKQIEDERRQDLWAAERAAGELIDRELNAQHERDPEARPVLERFLVVGGHLYKWSNNKGQYLSGSYSLHREYGVERLDLPPAA